MIGGVHPRSARPSLRAALERTRHFQSPLPFPHLPTVRLAPWCGAPIGVISEISDFPLFPHACALTNLEISDFFAPIAWLAQQNRLSVAWREEITDFTDLTDRAAGRRQ